MKHKWLIVPSNKKEFDKFMVKLPANDRLAIFAALAELAQADNPCAVLGVKKICSEGSWRQRAGDYRIKYQVVPGIVLHLKCEYKGSIVIEKIDHRKNVYR